MIDPRISLSLTMYSSPGVYALLIGSGVSRATGIPTGWEIILNLIEKLALLQEEDCGGNPEEWYRNQYEEEPDYSKLLKELFKTSAERQQALKSYFEPTEEDREEGRKVPTQAHKEIAELVQKGYIRVILTTNFDRLLEEALVARAITPRVITDNSTARGAVPLVHERCTIIKVNGDYLDTHFKNTPEELAKKYSGSLSKLINQVFDEYGLIICGWSAEWDTALRKRIETKNNFRFSGYWIDRSPLSDRANQLLSHRKGNFIQLEADRFFLKLSEQIGALEEIDQPHPLSTPMAISTLKKYLAEDKYRIRLQDFVMEYVEDLLSQITDRDFPTHVRGENIPDKINRIHRYNALSEMLLGLIMTGCYWGDEDPKHQYLWVEILRRLGNYSYGWGEDSSLVNLSLYPALLLLYAAGIISIAAKKYSTLAALLGKVERKSYPKNVSIICDVWPGNIVEKNVADRFLGKDNFYLPVNEILYQQLREPLRQYLKEDEAYEKCFDRFEYLLALAYVDLNNTRLSTSMHPWGPPGRFAWKFKHKDLGVTSIMDALEREITEQKESWPLLKEGLFQGSLEKLKQVKQAFDKFIPGFCR